MLVITHPGEGHSAGDLVIWLPIERILFAGDLLIEDGVTMIVDGSSGELLRGLRVIDSLRPQIAVPGHGSIPQHPEELVARTRAYIIGLRRDMKAAVEHGVPMRRALASLPPVDETRPVSYNSRRRRNAVRVYLEEEKRYMGLDSIQ
jgi:glyoxylase-like metal-dependent hydrolase (beta-lactamase superfamily II)